MINGYSRLMKIRIFLLSALCLVVALFWPGWRSELRAQGYYGYDAEKPSLAPEVNKTILWPPNHKMVKITIDTNAFDNSGTTTLTASVMSNEPEDGLGDGDVSPDWTQPVVDQKTGIITLQLRSERSGTGNGRTYTIVVTATDPSGNSNTTFLNIIAPHAIATYKIQTKKTPTIGSVVVNQAAVQTDYRRLSDLELAIKLNGDARLALSHQAQEAVGNPDLLLKYHQQDVQLKQEAKRLEMEYNALKTKLEADKKMKAEAAKRSFKLNI